MEDFCFELRNKSHLWVIVERWWNTFRSFYRKSFTEIICNGKSFVFRFNFETTAETRQVHIKQTVPGALNGITTD